MNYFVFKLNRFSEEGWAAARGKAAGSKLAARSGVSQQAGPFSSFLRLLFLSLQKII